MVEKSFRWMDGWMVMSSWSVNFLIENILFGGVTVIFGPNQTTAMPAAAAVKELGPVMGRLCPKLEITTRITRQQLVHTTRGVRLISAMIHLTNYFYSPSFNQVTLYVQTSLLKPEPLSPQLDTRWLRLISRIKSSVDVNIEPRKVVYRSPSIVSTA
jgi:hypothetical protein